MSTFDSIGQLEDSDFDQNGRLKPEEIKGLGNKPMLVMVYGNYCGHCSRAKPAYLQVFKEHKQSKVFLATLQTDSKDPSVAKLAKRFPDILKRQGIVFQGVPTYILAQNGKMTEYTGGRDALAITRFINSI